MKRAFQVVALCALLLLGAHAYRVASRHAERKREVSVPVLMYHRIGDGGNSVWWVPASVLDQQMRFLKESGYTSVLPSDLVAHRKRGRRLPAKPVVITFDDGHLNSMTEAEPILAKYGFRAVDFLITDFVAETPEERKSYEDAPCLIWPEVRAMLARGTFLFGGHSMTHANLAAMGSSASREIDGCWKALVEHGIRPEGFCYPYGQYKDETREAVRKSPFKIAFTTDDQVALVGGTNSLRSVPRVSVYGGAHEFSLVHAGSPSDDRGRATNEIVVTLAFKGRPLPCSPRLLWPGMAPAEGWLDPRDFAPGATELVWRVEHAMPLKGPLTLEVWDALHVLRHYRAAVSLADGA